MNRSQTSRRSAASALLLAPFLDHEEDVDLVERLDRLDRHVVRSPAPMPMMNSLRIGSCPLIPPCSSTLPPIIPSWLKATVAANAGRVGRASFVGVGDDGPEGAACERARAHRAGRRAGRRPTPPGAVCGGPGGATGHRRRPRRRAGSDRRRLRQPSGGGPPPATPATSGSARASRAASVRTASRSCRTSRRSRWRSPGSAWPGRMRRSSRRTGARSTARSAAQARQSWPS